MENNVDEATATPSAMPATRGYQQEMLDESMRRNIIIALDTGSGKTLIAVLRMKHEMEREPKKISWFFAPTVALCEQQKNVIKSYLPVSVGIVSGSNEPDQWKDASLWERVLRTHRVMISTPQVFLDALRHGYISLGNDISLLIFDEAHHAVDNHPYNRIMMEFYFALPPRTEDNSDGPVRPMVLGLTASPIYGGNVIKAFEKIESNLDSTIRAPRRNRAELAKYVHRPIFKHLLYNPPDEDFSTNLASLSAVIQTLNIENDPYVISLREQLKKVRYGSFEYGRVDQKLSKVIQKENSFTHKGLRDFERAATDICHDLGPWAADWFVWSVIQRAKQAANPYDTMMTTWRRTEKVYLLDTLQKVQVSPVSYYADDIGDDCSDKTRALIECLLMEKAEVESRGEAYSSIIFVQRRDAVIALAELLRHHPKTKDVFEVGTLLGSSDSSFRHSMMDIARTMVKDAQEQVISEFKAGEKNLIVSTSVAEEGIDIQACCSVIRWDPPPNMASWAQSRGRARKRQSTFTLMFEEGNKQQKDVAKWESLEQQMIALYNDPSRTTSSIPDDLFDCDEEEEEEDDDMILCVESTGALLTLHSAISHLSHFCAVIPNTTHADNTPLYDIDPPEFPEGWHALAETLRPQAAYAGPYGSRVTLPRSLPLPERQFTVDRIYKSKISAYRHVAFKAYKCLYDAGLLNDNLLPITSVVEPELEEEVKSMLADVEKRSGFAKITMSVDPWAPEDPIDDSWQCSEVTLEGLPPLYMFTKSEVISLDLDEGPKLYRTGLPVVRTSVLNVGRQLLSEELLLKAKKFTRRIFWGLNNTRMEWDNLDFSYLFLPVDDVETDWDVRRSWLASVQAEEPERYPHHLMVKAEEFGEKFRHPSDLTLIHRHVGMGRPFKFVRWRHEPLLEEEEEELKLRYGKHFGDVEVTYPVLVVQAFPPRTNFLIPTVPVNREYLSEPPPLVHLLPRFSGVVLLSPEDTEYAFLLPSVLRSLSMSSTANSLRKNLFSSTPLKDISISLLTTAITAPSSGERLNYQRMETLGDTVVKFMVGIQLLAEYPLWHEGYLTRKKDHAVSNVRLAKEDISRGLYRWIIRDIMLGKKWKPKYFTVQGGSNDQTPSPTVEESPTAIAASQEQSKERQIGKKKKSKKDQQLSTKVLADVVESVIGAAFLHGGFSFGYECIKFFSLGLKWEPLALTDEETAHLPPQLGDVESMLGYTFKRKLLLIEALTHGSYQSDIRAPSYERMEFLGDSVLDMIVTNYLYHAPGKNYSPGHMHLRKSAVVNGHILSYICLKTHKSVEAVMPQPDANGRIGLSNDNQEINLWKCLLHSNPKVLEDQLNTFTRYRKRKDEIEESLMTGTVFPWAALTRLQAPKFFSDMIESIIGAVFLDSEGSFPVVQRVLTTLGIMPLLEHIVKDDVDILHPVSRLSLWAQKHGKSIEYAMERSKGNITCTILVDEKEEVKVTEVWRGKPSQEEVKYIAAEMAIKAFKLRDVGEEIEIESVQEAEAEIV
ncbi:P-loop containing nucleoside triphosphate hydrolase protein [Agrocybe pediades]|nr:P-loop containing nucleoside triphosphate hydrolase protein [Agrocybe pediades]